MCSRETRIKKYFNQGYSYPEILFFLEKNHGCKLSLRSLKRILFNLGLKRKGVPESPREEVCAAIIEELNGSGCCLGYKSMWNRLKLTYGLNVKREVVRQILLVADPEGVHERARKRLRRRKYYVPGPNFLWHLDGYDKLKPFGFAIHGCIDGFSRKILWLNVAASNNKPEIIAHYYLSTIQKRNFLPKLIRSDLGTENSIIEVLQQSLRFYHDDKLAGYNSFIKGRSTSNQRIESYWSQLRRHGANFWISLFKDLREIFLFNDADPVQVECLRYSFGSLIQEDLNFIRREWNRHKIRAQKNNRLPSGRPNCLYYFSENYGARDFKKDVDPDAILICKTNYAIEPKMYRDEMEELASILLPHNMDTPRNVEEALELYTLLQEKISECQ